MDDFLGAAFYRNATSKSVYGLSSAEAFYKHTVKQRHIRVNAARRDEEEGDEGGNNRKPESRSSLRQSSH